MIKEFALLLGPLLVLGGGGALVVVVAGAVPLTARRLGSARSNEVKVLLRTCHLFKQNNTNLL